MSVNAGETQTVDKYNNTQYADVQHIFINYVRIIFSCEIRWKINNIVSVVASVHFSIDNNRNGQPGEDSTSSPTSRLPHGGIDELNGGSVGANWWNCFENLTFFSRGIQGCFKNVLYDMKRKQKPKSKQLLP